MPSHQVHAAVIPWTGIDRWGFLEHLRPPLLNPPMLQYDCPVLLTEDGRVVLYNKPYQLCVLADFITSRSSKDYLDRLREELSRLKFVEKNNDLYQFRQVHLIFTP